MSLRKPWFIIVWFEDNQWQIEFILTEETSGDVYTCDEDVFTQGQAKEVAMDLLTERQMN